MLLSSRWKNTLDVPSRWSASAHAGSSRRSARNLRVEIITRGERRRSWSAEQKDQIVAESLGPDLTPTEVARKHGISSGQLYTLRQLRLSVQTALVTRAAPRFAEVDAGTGHLGRAADPEAGADAPPSAALAPRPEGLIEIVLPGGMVVRMDAHVDGSRAAPGSRCAGRPMIALASGLRVYLACGITDMRKRDAPGWRCWWQLTRPRIRSAARWLPSVAVAAGVDQVAVAATVWGCAC